MKLVRARSRDHVDLAANRPAILRRQDAFENLHLGDRLHAQDLNLVLAAVVAKAAVLGVGLCAAAVDVDGASAVTDSVHAEGPAAPEGVIGRTDTRGQQDDVLQIPPRDRNFSHLAAQRLRLRRRHRFDQRSGFSDGDLLGNVADFEQVSLTHRLTGAESQSSTFICLESRELDFDGIWAGRKGRERKLTTFIGHRFSYQIGTLVGDRNAHAR